MSASGSVWVNASIVPSGEIDVACLSLAVLCSTCSDVLPSVARQKRSNCGCSTW
jgi:hypothetical protein